MRRLVDGIVVASVLVVIAGWWSYEASAPTGADRRLPVLLTGAVIALVVPAVVGSRRRPASSDQLALAAAGPLVAVGYFRLLEPAWAATVGAFVWYASALILVVVADVLVGRRSGWNRPSVWVGSLVLAGCWVVGSAPARSVDEQDGVRSATWSWIETIEGRLGLPSRDVRRWQSNPLGWLPSDTVVRASWIVWSTVIVVAAVATVIAVGRRVTGRRIDVIPHVAVLTAVIAQSLAAWPERLSVAAEDSLIVGRWYSELLVAVPAWVALGLGVGATWQELIRPRLVGGVDDALQLDHDSSPTVSRDELRSTLGDPTARLLFPADDGSTGEWLDDRGARTELAADAHRAATIVEQDGIPVAAVEYDVALVLQPDLVDVAATSTSLSLERRRVAALAERDAADARASATRLLVAEEASRADLRDRVERGPGRSLTEAHRLLRQRPPRLEATHDVIRDAIVSIREIARSETPPSISELGVAGALADLASSSGREIDVTVPPERLAPVDALTVYLVVADAVRHPDTTRSGDGRIAGELTCRSGQLHLCLAGVGRTTSSAVVDRIDTLGGSLRHDGDVLTVVLPDARLEVRQ